MQDGGQRRIHTGILIGHHFHIGGPAFGEAGEGKHTAYRFQTIAIAHDRLIQMTGKTFMGNRGEQIQIRGNLVWVVVNHIFLVGVNRGNQIKCRSSIGGQIIVHDTDGGRGVVTDRKIRCNGLLQR